MHVFYRYSDSSNVANSNPTRPPGFDKKQIFINFLEIFKGHKIHVVADNVKPESAEWLRTLCDDVEVTSIGSGDGSWLYSVKKAIDTCSASDIVYLCEDDYIHLPGSPGVIEQGLKLADYVTLYDHPDKYKNGYNPFIQHEGEISLVRQTPDGTHWKFTNSTTGTHGARVAALIRDWKLFEDILGRAKEIHAQGHSPDFVLWVQILKNCKLASCMPGYASHLHIPWITVSPAIDQHIKKVLCVN
jgi:hypothetical protein